ncbi:MAG TPA: TlpA disulfide reductase family protein [Thermoanaerobaculia bacterium]|nr:TlpA disulfide reductase family protein [Thermoanaerobaculia bacterium]
MGRVVLRGFLIALGCAAMVGGAASSLSAAAPATAAPGAGAPARPDLVRIVRFKLSAADLASAEAWTDDWRRDFGSDATWIDARAWLARGAWMLGEKDRALVFAAEVRAAIAEPSPETLTALGAAIEVEGRILAERQGAAAGVRFFHDAEKLSTDPAFRSRLWKNVNRLELVGQPAPPWSVAEHVGTVPPTLASLRGRPVLLFLWAAGCGDCRASAPTVAEVRARFGPRGLSVVAPTRLWGFEHDGVKATPAEERAEISRVLREEYKMADLPVPVDADALVRYGASATPTFVLIDTRGIVRLFAPTRMTYAALAAAIEPLLPRAGH